MELVLPQQVYRSYTFARRANLTYKLFFLPGLDSMRSNRADEVPSCEIDQKLAVPMKKEGD